MLEKLLSEIRSGGTLETGELARRYGVSPQMVGAMLEHLQRAGYLSTYHPCGDGCGGCSLRRKCGGAGQMLVYSFDEKAPPTG